MKVTNQKALEYMQNIRIDFSRIEQGQEARQVADLCIIALEKQNPAKPKYDDCCGGYQCPKCGEYVVDFSISDHENVPTQPSYCWNCGRKLDWGEEQTGEEK